MERQVAEDPDRVAVFGLQERLGRQLEESSASMRRTLPGARARNALTRSRSISMAVTDATRAGSGKVNTPRGANLDNTILRAKGRHVEQPLRPRPLQERPANRRRTFHAVSSSGNLYARQEPSLHSLEFLLGHAE